MFSSYTNGLLLGLSLIVAIGAQNAYVLRQAIRREHHWLIASICSLSDVGLIMLGVAGLGAVIQASPRLETAFYFAGALFLGHHAFHAARDAIRAKQALALDADDDAPLPRDAASCSTP
ncbi:LysE/ArgO family amino acid transporter [Acidihalobacter yilgarnensis]|uniref:LysE/ArgO family amino acid transporter n=1 Tax=Acidihalobacter yilgarnensis TaxID=2819280 RepID=UPI0009F3E339|nr:LysE family transporter [Acidihalobacter yilgarnensis]